MIKSSRKKECFIKQMDPSVKCDNRADPIQKNQIEDPSNQSQVPLFIIFGIPLMMSAHSKYPIPSLLHNS